MSAKEGSGANLDRGQHPGDILLFYHPKGLSKLIAWITMSKFYHVAIYAGDYAVVEARPPGVRKRDLRGPEGGHDFEVIPAPQGAGGAALKWALEQVGKRYDESGP